MQGPFATEGPSVPVPLLLVLPFSVVQKRNPGGVRGQLHEQGGGVAAAEPPFLFLSPVFNLSVAAVSVFVVSVAVFFLFFLFFFFLSDRVVCRRMEVELDGGG